MSETIVVFRKDRTGWKDCFALFPELPGDDLRAVLHRLPTHRSALRSRLPRLYRPERPGNSRRVCRPLRGTGEAGIHPDRPPAGHARDA